MSYRRLTGCGFVGRVMLGVVASMALTHTAAKAQAVAIAEVDGHVADPTGASVAGAKVRITETETQQAHLAVTDSAGRYQLPNLPIGPYRLEVSADGFKVFIQTGIVLQVGNNVEVNVALQLGSLSESVEVSAEAAMVETKDNAVAEVIDSKRMVDLPLNGRNPTQLITLVAAAATAPAGDLTGSKNIQGSNGSGTFTVGGSQANGLSYLLDGGDNNDAFSNVNLPLPFPDALEEFSVETNALPAQYGLHPGGVVNAVTKSGSNDFHGDLFEFLRNGDLDARQEGTLTRDTLKRSQFGGVLGGRIVRNKLFFFGGFQGTRQRSNPPSSIAYVPTPAVLAGNFSLFETPQSQGGCLSKSTGRTLVDPYNGQAYAGNQIPVSQFSAPALNFVTKYLPAAGNQCGEVQFGIPANNPDNQWIGRVDYIRSEKHSMYGRFYLYDYTAETTFNGSDILTTTTAGNQDRSVTATFGDTYSLSATAINSFHATFDRRRDDRGAAPNLISPTSLGVNMFNLLPNFIDISVSNYNIGAGCGTCAPGYFNVNDYQLSDDFTLIRGQHQMQFGVDARREQLNIANNQQVNGQFTFSGTGTGDALADLLIGYVSTFNDGNPNPDALRETVFAAYAQDTFRATPTLTLNFGLRWEPSLPSSDAFKRGNQFSLPLFDAGVHSTVYPNAPAGLLFAGDPQNPYGAKFTNDHWLTVSPRIGLVFDPKGDGKQTIRAAFALMHDTAELFFPERWTTNPPYASSITLNNISFANPWAGYAGGNPFPGAAIFPVGGTYISIPPNMPPTYMMQWNLSLQRQLARDWLVTVNYLGNATRHIWGSFDVNPSVYIPGSTASTNKRRILYLQDPAQGQYYSEIQQADPGGNSSYHALVFSVRHRFANYFTLLTNYTWSHCISDVDFTGELAGTIYQDPYSRTAETGSCNFDHRQLIVTSLVVTTPGVGNRLAKQVTGNWQVSPIFSANSGSPLTLTDGGVDISGSGQLQDRPNDVLPNAVYPATQTLNQWFNPAAFAEQPKGTFGNTGRDALTGPGYWDMDVALSRLFRIRERTSIELRGEAFNFFNHGNWNAPTVSITSSQFGQITTFGNPRILQMGLKLAF